MDKPTPGYEEICFDCPYRGTYADECGVSHDCLSDEECIELVELEEEWDGT
jgi:hypothetical protein